ncbi:MAG: GNAT family N-acetyltransferase [Streptomyces sp.]|uniref:GNAT family N-acetyltransferase n=1 Tax=Streptomyces sp. TaxID=1931 RepID=UPI003D6C60D4
MTTTLRPTGPEQRGAGGVRSRSYDICVNSRPVGLLRLATDARYGPAAGRVEQLVVDERERRRGRGAVAALAAEEVLREWGCARVEAGIPATAAAALRLADGLGYRERSRNMLKELEEEPRLPSGSSARPMTDAEFPAWRERGRPQLLRTLLDRGVPAEGAERKADEDFRTLLPAGAATSGAVLRVLVHEDSEVGTLWVDVANSPRTDADSWVFDVEVAEERRGHGHGRTLMLLAERESLAAGARVLGLKVYAGNAPAQRLYASLGYRSVEHHLWKPLV